MIFVFCFPKKVSGFDSLVLKYVVMIQKILHSMLLFIEVIMLLEVNLTQAFS